MITGCTGCHTSHPSRVAKSVSRTQYSLHSTRRKYAMADDGARERATRANRGNRCVCALQCSQLCARFSSRSHRSHVCVFAALQHGRAHQPSGGRRRVLGPGRVEGGTGHSCVLPSVSTSHKPSLPLTSQEAADEEYKSEKEEADVFDSDFGDEEVCVKNERRGGLSSVV